MMMPPSGSHKPHANGKADWYNLMNRNNPAVRKRGIPGRRAGGGGGAARSRRALGARTVQVLDQRMVAIGGLRGA